MVFASTLALNNVDGFVALITWGSLETRNVNCRGPLVFCECVSTPVFWTCKLWKMCGPSTVNVQLVTTISAPSYERSEKLMKVSCVNVTAIVPEIEAQNSKAMA